MAGVGVLVGVRVGRGVWLGVVLGPGRVGLGLAVRLGAGVMTVGEGAGRVGLALGAASWAGDSDVAVSKAGATVVSDKAAGGAL